ncbi:MAG: hypothetical protein FWG50_05460 [Kiritimatiellaeota bacterium]|nr:hypothetical protein [Kiritimatiellota bacterium]
MWGWITDVVGWLLEASWLFVFVGFLVLCMLGMPILCIHNLIRNRRERKQSKKQMRETIAMMEKKGKIMRKPGKYRPRNWAYKWIIYSKGIPPHRHRYEFGRELPPLPKQDD